MIPIPIPEMVNVQQIIPFGNDFCGVGNIRVNGDLDVYLFKFNSKGELLQEQKIGEAKSFERGTAIVWDGKQFTVLVNKAINNQPQIELLYLSKDFEIVDRLDLSHNKKRAGESMTQTTDNELLISFSYEESPENYFPLAVLVDSKKQVISQTKMDYNNPSEFKIPDTSNLPKAMQAQLANFSTELLKLPVNMVDINDKIYVLGSENTDNFGDNWAACLDKKGNILWEKLYEKKKEPGVDFLSSALEASGEHIAFFGQHYNKKNNLDYNFNYLLVDKNGDLLLNKRYSLGFDEQFGNAQKVGDNFLLCGFVNEEPVKEGWVGDNIQDVNIWLLLINENGDKLHELYLKKQGFQRLIDTVKINDNQLLHLIRQKESEADGYYIFEMEIQD